MNKKLLKLVTSFAVMLVCISMVAMAAPAITSTPVAGTGSFTTTVNVTGVGASDEVSLLVVKAGTDLTKLTANDVLYIDQATAASGAASFEFVTTTNAFDVYSGYSTMALTDNPLNVKYDGAVVTGPSMDATKSKLYSSTSPFGLEGCRRVFIKLTNDNGNWIPAHTGEGSEIYYSTELQGYDGIVKTTAADLAAIFAEISWTQGTPSAEATIAKYGDVSGDGQIKMADYVSIRKNLLNAVTYNTKQNLTADVSDDAQIKMADYVAVRKLMLNAITEFAAVSNRK